jgi:hypothetical protein
MSYSVAGSLKFGDRYIDSEEGIQQGLLLNIAKCELISHSGLPSTSPLDQFTHVTPDNATLLGAPLTIGSAMDMILHKKLTELQRASDRLKRISSHDALVLLKASCGAPKLTHILRSSPCHGHSTLQEIDKVLYCGLGSTMKPSASQSVFGWGPIYVLLMTVFAALLLTAWVRMDCLADEASADLQDMVTSMT